MKSRDITQTPIFRKYGAKGMRRYCIVWGAFMYLLLISISGGGFYGLMQIIDELGLRITQEPGLSILLFAAIALIVAAASLLTKMLIGIFNELRASESQQKADSKNN
jgi:hypothetical protein